MLEKQSGTLLSNEQSPYTINNYIIITFEDLRNSINEIIEIIFINIEAC